MVQQKHSPFFLAMISASNFLALSDPSILSKPSSAPLELYFPHQTFPRISFTPLGFIWSCRPSIGALCHWTWIEPIPTWSFFQNKKRFEHVWLGKSRFEKRAISLFVSQMTVCILPSSALWLILISRTCVIPTDREMIMLDARSLQDAWDNVLLGTITIRWGSLLRSDIPETAVT